MRIPVIITLLAFSLLLALGFVALLIFGKSIRAVQSWTGRWSRGFGIQTGVGIILSPPAVIWMVLRASGTGGGADWLGWAYLGYILVVSPLALYGWWHLGDRSPPQPVSPNGRA
jgi:hypothetical protein